MTRRIFAIWLLAACLASAGALAEEPKIIIVQGRALVDVESLTDQSGNRVKPIEHGETNSAAIAQATINTSAVNRFFSKFGSSTGDTRGLYLNGRLYAINDTINEGSASWLGYGGMIIDGGGGKAWNNSPLGTIRFNAASTGQPIQSVGGFVWVGNPGHGDQPYTDRPMIRLRGFGASIDNCHFMGWRHVSDTVNASRPTRASDMAKTAIEISYVVNSVPSGKHSLVDNSFAFCQAAYRVTGVSHADNCYFGGKQIFSGCSSCLVCEGNSQAVGFVGDSWEVNQPFDPVKVCSFDHGGKVHLDALKMVALGTIFETFGVSASESDFSVDRLWWDNSALDNDGIVFPHTYFNSGPNSSQQFNYSANCDLASPTVLNLIGITAKAEDIGKLLVITGAGAGGTDHWIKTIDSRLPVGSSGGAIGPYQIVDCTEGGTTWTLDRACVSDDSTKLMGYASGSTSSEFTIDTDDNDVLTHEALSLPVATEVRLSSTGTLPSISGGGTLSASTTYYAIAGPFTLPGLPAITKPRATSTKLAATQADAFAGTAINITGAGSGTHRMTAVIKSYPGQRANCRLVDMQEAGSAYFDVNGHLSKAGRDLPNMVRVLGADANVRVHLHNAHRALKRAYDPLVPVRPERPFLPNTDNLQLFVDVEDQVNSGGVDYTVTPSHDTVDDPVNGIDDASAAANNLFRLTPDGSRPTIGGWQSMIHHKRSLRFLGGDGLKNDSPTNLRGLANLSVGGVVRLNDPVATGVTQTICGVWQESGNQRCWRIGVNDNEQMFLELSTGGTFGTTERFVMTERALEVARAHMFYIVWNKVAQTVSLYLDDVIQLFDASDNVPANNLYSGMAPFTLGCSGNYSLDSLIGDVPIVMIDNAALSTSEIEYRAEEFAARRGTYLNSGISP